MDSHKSVSSMHFNCSYPLDVYSCIKCNIGFTLKSNLLEHVMDGHKSDKNAPETCYKCHKCGFITFSKIILAKHDINCDLTPEPQYPESILTAPFEPEEEDVLNDKPVHDIVCSLLRTPFRTLSEKEQNEIVLRGRPTPVMSAKLTKEFEEDEEIYGEDEESDDSKASDDEESNDSKASNDEDNSSEHSNSSTDEDSEEMKVVCYIGHSWLCGSYYLNQAFCWPCLLFGESEELWNRFGINDLRSISFYIQLHEEDDFHLESTQKYQQFKNKIDPDNTSMGDFNENVRLNIFLAEMFVRATPLSLKSANENSVDSFRHLIEFMLRIGTIGGTAALNNHYENIKTVFPGDLEVLYKDLFKCVGDTIQKHIKNELKSVPFYTLRIDDAFLLTGEGQCSIILRFVNRQGVVKEHFLGFFQFNEDIEKSLELVETVLGDLEYRKKLVGQCYDGGKPALILDLLQRKIKEEVHQALLMYTPEHRFDLLVQQSMKNYWTLDFIWNFYQLNKIVKRVIKIVPDWPAKPKNPYKIVKDRWQCLKNAISQFADDDENSYYDAEAYYTARSLLRDMEDFYFTFYTCVFSEIFEKIQPLVDYLQEDHINVDLLCKKFTNSYKKISQMKNEQTFRVFHQEAKDRTEDLPQKRDYYVTRYFETIENMLLELNVRFQDVINLRFLHLADSSRFKEFSKDFPLDLCQNLQRNYPDVFVDFQILINELELFYQIETYHDLNLQDIVKLMNGNDFHLTVFSEVYKLFSLVLTLPTTNIANKSVLKYIKTCLENSTVDHLDHRLDSCQMQCEYLEHVTASTKFTQDVFKQWVNMNPKPVDFFFKE